MTRIVAVDLGLLPYAKALEIQRAAARARLSGELRDDVLLLVEHPPVVTLGRAAQKAHVVVPQELLATRGVEVFEVERGGDVTFHGPGQLVGYPIFDLRQHKQDLHWYLRQLEEALILALQSYELLAWRNAGYTGVWVGPERPRKIASIGVHARDWVTWHGFALNVTTDLTFFELIVPCGIQNVEMTSLARETGRDDVTVVRALPDVANALGSAFERDVEWESGDILGALSTQTSAS
ncbi:MAG TPA: lipoyl(octanoyl) transferase LipB [Gemmatimonadaceae bacterium]|nr:lipoyl(octanoyl) transferase LipB [Gemmatimonadaceae bacterium]